MDMSLHTDDDDPEPKPPGGVDHKSNTINWIRVGDAIAVSLVVYALCIQFGPAQLSTPVVTAVDVVTAPLHYAERLITSGVNGVSSFWLDVYQHFPLGYLSYELNEWDKLGKKVEDFKESAEFKKFVKTSKDFKENSVEVHHIAHDGIVEINGIRVNVTIVAPKYEYTYEPPPPPTLYNYGDTPKPAPDEIARPPKPSSSFFNWTAYHEKLRESAPPLDLGDIEEHPLPYKPIVRDENGDIRVTTDMDTAGLPKQSMWVGDFDDPGPALYDIPDKQTVVPDSKPVGSPTNCRIECSVVTMSLLDRIAQTAGFTRETTQLTGVPDVASQRTTIVEKKWKTEAPPFQKFFATHAAAASDRVYMFIPQGAVDHVVCYTNPGTSYRVPVTKTVPARAGTNDKGPTLLWCSLQMARRQDLKHDTPLVIVLDAVVVNGVDIRMAHARNRLLSIRSVTEMKLHSEHLSIRFAEYRSALKTTAFVQQLAASPVYQCVFDATLASEQTWTIPTLGCAFMQSESHYGNPLVLWVIHPPVDRDPRKKQAPPPPPQPTAVIDPQLFSSVSQAISKLQSFKSDIANASNAIAFLPPPPPVPPPSLLFLRRNFPDMYRHPVHTSPPPPRMQPVPMTEDDDEYDPLAPRVTQARCALLRSH